MIRAKFTPAVAAPTSRWLHNATHPPSTKRSHRRNMRHANVTQNEVPENSKRALKNEGEGPPRAMLYIPTHCTSRASRVVVRRSSTVGAAQTVEL